MTRWLGFRDAIGRLSVRHKPTIELWQRLLGPVFEGAGSAQSVQRVIRAMFATSGTWCSDGKVDERRALIELRRAVGTLEFLKEKGQGNEMKTERRFTRGAEVRATANASTPKIEGYAAVFNEDFVLYEDPSVRVVERIKPGAFSKVLNSDVRCLFNHDANAVLGRSDNGTLDLSQDGKGLAYRNAMNMDTHVGADVYAMVKRGDVTGCSFAFVVAKDEVTRTKGDGQQLVIREIQEIESLFDVGPVTYPAYEQTSVDARAEQRDRLAVLPEDIREMIENANSVRARQEKMAEILASL
ncbi:MAG: HK97 family phage prohead protease [Terriglobales bacterium]